MNQNTQSILSCIYFAYNFTRNLKKNIKLVPMNPDVSLAEKDVLKRPLFRDDDKLLTRVMSEEF